MDSKRAAQSEQKAKVSFFDVDPRFIYPMKVSSELVGRSRKEEKKDDGQMRGEDNGQRDGCLQMKHGVLSQQAPLMENGGLMKQGRGLKDHVGHSKDCADIMGDDPNNEGSPTCNSQDHQF